MVLNLGADLMEDDVDGDGWLIRRGDVVGGKVAERWRLVAAGGSRFVDGG